MPVSPAALRSDFRALARCLTLVENDFPDGKALLRALSPDLSVPVFGFTGAPGAGKSTLINALAGCFVAAGKRLAILAVDPTSPFSSGSLLGDRVRMSGQFLPGSVFIRSLATRGSLGGVSVKAFELVDVLRSAGFDYIFVETVGVGQSEVEIAGLADLTALLLVSGSGDEVQLLKSGIMEIADVFIVNKADLAGAQALASALKKLVSQGNGTPVFETSSSSGKGIAELADYLSAAPAPVHSRKARLLADKAWRLIEAKRMAGINRNVFREVVEAKSKEPGFNLYRFADEFED
jgi:LAO/AO transport system kinase